MLRPHQARFVAVVVAGSLAAASCTGADPAPLSSEALSSEALSSEALSSEALSTPSTEAGGGTGAETTSTLAAPTDEPTAGVFDWTTVDPGDPRVEEGVLEVPLDHDDPNLGTIDLYVVRHRATDPANRIGALLVNPGGPGLGGSFLAQYADQIYGRDLLERFDIIGWDPRGTGLSEPFIDCVDDLDPYFTLDASPDTPEEELLLVTALGEFTEGCADRSGDLLEHITTVDAARDMDDIRRALGEDRLSYFGWSYGTKLGAVWATLFPGTVRAAVLDGAMDPTVGRIDGLVDQAAGFESTFESFLADCAADAACPINNGGDPEARVAELLTRIETEVIPTSPGRPDLTSGIAETGIANALYREDAWPSLAQALADALGGDGAGLLAQFDQYMVRLPDGSYSNDLEAYFAISCVDDPDTAGIEAAVAARERFTSVAPLVGSTIAAEALVCAQWPSLDPVVTEMTGVGAGPIVVVGNTGDPATPFEGSRRMAEALDGGVFVAVEADSHTAYGLNPCIDSLIEAYLVDLDIPAEGTTC